MNVKLAQHIYGNVEAEQSPHKIGGFQTLFYTHSLISEEESSEIEGRVIYHQSENNPFKYVFFSLDNNNIVVSRIVPLADSDRFGREGTYLAHSVIMEAADFDKLGTNPYTLFQVMEKHFLSDVASAMAVGNRSSGNMDCLLLEIPDRTEPPDVGNWNTDELLKLAHFAVHCKTTRANRNPLVLVGKPEQMLAILELIFTYVPINWRRQCNFDTHFIDCNIVHGDFWCVGYPASSHAPSHLTIVQLDQQQVTGQVPAPENRFEQWVQDCIRNGKIHFIGSYGEIAHVWMQFLSGGKYDSEVIAGSLGHLPAEFFDTLSYSYKSLLLERTRHMLSDMAGPLLAERLESHPDAYPYGQLQKDSRGFFKQILDGFDLNKIADQCYTLLKPELKDKASRKELKEIKALYKKTAHKPLQLLSNVWRMDEDELTGHLTDMDEDPSLFSSLLEELDQSRLKVIKKLVKKLEKPVPKEFSDLLYRLLPDKKRSGFFRKLMRKLPFIKR